MGVLEIRMRRESLGNIGGIAARAAEDRTAAARIRAQTDTEKVRSLLGGLSAIQQGVERWDAADRSRRESGYLADLQNEFNSWMNGDGSAENPGKWNENPQDVGTWAQEVRTKYAEIADAARKRYKLNDREFETVSRSADAFRNQWFGRISTRAAETTRRNEQASATALVKADELTLSHGDGSPELYAQYARHKLAELDAYGIADPAQRQLALRKAGLELCETGVKNYLRDTAERADAAGEGGAKVWDEAVKALESGDGGSLLPPNAAVPTADGKGTENVIGQWVEGADLENLRKSALDDLRENRRRWIRADAARAAEKTGALKAEFANAEQELFRGEIPKTPEGEAAYFDQQALGYRALADKADAAGMKDVALRYRKASESLGFKSVAKADEAERARQDETFEANLADFNAGGWLDERGDFHEMDFFQRKDKAISLLASGRIRRNQFDALMRVTDEEWDADAKAFRDDVLGMCKSLVPNAIRYNARRNAFEFNSTKDVHSNTPIPSGGEIPSLWEVRNGYEQATYGDLIDAMRTALRWRLANKKGGQEMREYFRTLTDGTVRKCQQETIRANNERENEIIGDYEKLHRKADWMEKNYFNGL